MHIQIYHGIIHLLRLIIKKINFLKYNNNNYFSDYFVVFKRYLLVNKDEVAHPIWNLQNRKKTLMNTALKQVKK